MKTVVLSLAIVLCALSLHSQSRIPMLGESAPSFNANSTNGTFEFPKDFGNSWKILFSHPKDFTPVCTSEILQLARMQSEFEELGVELAIISTDQLDSHFEWKQLIEDILIESGHSVLIECFMHGKIPLRM
jgi:peroxiredoxin (alkyl hydroperoxide reductase subunit C)